MSSLGLKKNRTAQCEHRLVRHEDERKQLAFSYGRTGGRFSGSSPRYRFDAVNPLRGL